MIGRWLARVGFVASVLLVGAWLRPLAAVAADGWRLAPNLVVAALFATIGLLAEQVIRTVPARTVAAALVGALAAVLVANVVLDALPNQVAFAVQAVGPFLQLVALFLGSVVGAAAAGPAPAPAPRVTARRTALLDTSAVIDGRIADLARTGLFDGEVAVPSFVLRELQAVADSEDPARRVRGRRGLECLDTLRAAPGIAFSVRDEDEPDAARVDDKLVALASRIGATLVTTDFNLAKIASLRGVSVANLNEIALALRTVLLPGQELRLQVLRDGKEPGQGVGYLDDGTMVVVERGAAHIGRSIDVVVTGSLQTAAGKMFFARPSGETDDSHLS